MSEEIKRSEGMREMFSFPKKELPMKTETPAGKLDAFVMMDVIEYAFSPPGVPRGTLPSELKVLLSRKGKRPREMLSNIYVEKHDYRMISKARKGRIEAEKMITSQGKDEVDELSI